MPELALHVEIGDAADAHHHALDIRRPLLEHFEVRPKNLDDQFPGNAGEGLLDVVLDVLREVEFQSGDLRHLRIHPSDQLILVVDVAPLASRLEVHVHFEIVRALGVGAVIRPAELREDLADLRGEQHDRANSPLHELRLLERDPDRHRDAEPNVALIERRQKLGAEPAADEQRTKEERQRAEERLTRVR